MKAYGAGLLSSFGELQVCENELRTYIVFVVFT